MILPQKTVSLFLVSPPVAALTRLLPQWLGGGLFIYFLKATGRSLAQLFGGESGEDISPGSTFSSQDETIRFWLEKDLSLFISQPALGKLREPCLHFGVWVEELACCGFLFLAVPKGPGRICAIKWFGSLDQVRLTPLGEGFPPPPPAFFSDSLSFVGHLFGWGQMPLFFCP